MKITVPRQEPLSLPVGKQQAKHVCRQYSSIACSIGEAAECPKEKQQLWLSRLGFGSSADCFPPDDAVAPSFTSNGTFFTKAKLDSIQPVLNRKYTNLESDRPIHRPAQVTSTSFRGLSQDRTESVQDQNPVDADMAKEKFVDRRFVDPSSSGEEHCSNSAFRISECDGEHQSPAGASEIVSTALVKLMCSFGGRIMARPVDGKLRYVGGETRIVSVCRSIRFAEFIFKMSEIYGFPLGVKYQLPDEDLDALISVSSDDDLQNMMEECDKSGPSGVGGSRLRLFFFPVSADVEFAESKREGGSLSSYTDQRYVDAINGLLAEPQAYHKEDDAAALQPTDGGGRVSPREQINEVAQCSALLSTLSSGQAGFRKPPGLLDLSLQNVNESLSKAALAPFRYEGEIDRDVFGNSTNTPLHHHYDRSQADFQLSQAMDSPRIFHPDGANSRNGQSLLGLRHVDSQSKLARLLDHHNESRSSRGAPLEPFHEAPYGHDMTLPQGDFDRASQQHALSLSPPQQSQHPHPPRVHHQHQHQHYQLHQRTPQPQQQYHHHQEQVQHHHDHHQHQSDQQQHSWYLHNEGQQGNAGRGDYFHQELHMQSQHHQLTQHQLIHDGCSWNAEHHASPCSTHPSAQMFRGLAPAPPYHMGSNPSSPRVGVYDHQGTFPCGSHHSQVHRGITVSIGEHTYDRRPPFQSDQAAQKQSSRGTSRFYDNGSYGIETAAWQQANQSILTSEVAHEESTNRWSVSHGRHVRDFQSTNCLTRNRDLQYTEPLARNGENLTVNDRRVNSMQCTRGNCIDNRKQPMDVTKGNFIFMEAPDHASDRPLHQKLSDLDGGRIHIGEKVFPRALALKDGQQNNFNERVLEVGYGLCALEIPGNSDSPVPMAAHIDGSRKLQLPSGAIKGSVVLSNDPVLALMPRSAELSSYLSKNSSETTISRSTPPSEPIDCYDALSCQPGQQMPLGKDLQTAIVVESLSGATKVGNFDKDLVHSDANNGAVMSMSFCGDEAFSVAGRVESDVGQHLSPQHVRNSKDQRGTNAWIAGQGNSQLLSPEVIPLGSMGSAGTSSVFDQSPFNSTDVSKFSFAAGRPLAPPADRILDKGPFALDMSVTGEWTESMASLVQHCSSDETLAFEMSDVDQDAAYSPEEEENVTKAEGTKMVSVKASIGKLQIGQDCGGSLGIMKGKTLEDGIEAVMDKTDPINGFLKVNALEDLEAAPVVLSCQSNKTSHQQDEASNSERNKPSVSESEAVAIARGLQIIKNSDLEDMKELGSGTYGTVYHGKWRGSDVAIKRIKASCFTGPSLDQGRLVADFWREACTLGKLHHPNVVAFYGVVPDGPDGTLATVTEYMVNGSLKQVLHKKDRTIDRRKRLFIAMDAAFGMEYLHSKNIVHFDLKCENLLVNMRDAHRPICKVGDFGLSKVKHHTLVSGGVRGTLPWMAPELLSGNCGMVSEKVDVYSFGIVMWELLTGEEPYANMHCGAIIGGIANNTLRPSIPSWCDPGWRRLMERCWCVNPAERPPFPEVAKELRAISATMNLK